ncbi:hypothetical protein Cgig2_018513 [Carnegiea gigantea]|uniref:Uncharacterized protein n=1 Tax=Carnegiea gigantea TaxID=171969 RepID=A0A9Q1QMX7_9CARY|nr:hypothetical protein Cgig2_018513 [Carnegiea gigantea]
MVQEEVDQEIPLVRNDVEPDLIDVDLVDTTITQHTYFEDEEVDVSEDEEDEFSDRESDIDSLDRDLEADDSENDKWNFPPEAEGINVARAVELQCMMLFRGWRYRPKEEHFTGKTVTEAIKNKPPEHISEKNRSNRLSQKITLSNGAKSTARIYHDEIMPLYNLAKDSTQGPTEEQTTEIPQDPPYVQLWKKTKKSMVLTISPSRRLTLKFSRRNLVITEDLGLDWCHIEEVEIERNPTTQESNSLPSYSNCNRRRLHYKVNLVS